jgi:predicted Zn-dependent protease
MANGKGALLIPATAKVTTQLAPTGRAAALLGLGRAREAMELVAPLLPLVPDDEDVIRIHAEATLACGDPRSALMQLTAALTRQPQAASLWHCGAQMLFRLRLSVKALDWVQRARHLGFDPRAVDGLEGEILLVAGDLLGAEAAFRRQPQDARCAGGLALVQEMNGQSDNPLVDKRACAERERMRANCGLARAGSA